MYLVLVGIGGLAGWVWHWQRQETRFSPEIRAAAARYHLDPLLVKSVVWRESRFRPEVRGRKGEIGLMQLQDVAAREWADAEHIAAFAHEQCLDPATNTLAGAFYLGKLLRRYVGTDDPIPYALAEYNAGRANVLKWNKGVGATNSVVFAEQIGFPGTKAYVKAVMRRYALYRWLARFGWG